MKCWGEARYLGDHVLRHAEHLLILAWETTEEFRDTGPLWEFLRHCRNASAHGGSFNLKYDEPRRPAEWGPFQITQELHGSRLFASRDESGVITQGLLHPGDPIRLLWDIEQAYPKMKVEPQG